MKAVRTSTRLWSPQAREFLRTFQTANQKQVEATAAVFETEAKTEWDMAKPFDEIPGPKPPPVLSIANLWRLFSMSTDSGQDVTNMYQGLYDAYGPIVRLTGVGAKDMIILYDPVDVEKMFRNESTWPERMSLGPLKHYRTVVRKDFYGDVEGLVTSQGEKWQTFRTATNQTMMQPKNVIMYLDSVAAVVDDFIDRIRYIRQPNQEMPEDFLSELNKLALESVGVVSLDTRLGCLAPDIRPDSDAMKMINNVKNAMHYMHILEFGASPWRYISTSTWRKYVKAMDEILDITIKHTYAKWEMIKKQEGSELGENKSILETLLLKTKNPKIPIVMTLDTLSEGIHTTSNTTGTFLYHLATNADKQENLFQELKRLLPKKDSKITKEVFNELKYVRAVIKESMRMKPTAGANQRRTKKDLVFSGYQVPNGSNLLSAHTAMCLQDIHFKDANKFIPERWLKTEKNSEYSSKTAHPFVFLPFGFGHRSCIARRFAEMEMELVLSKLIRNFQVSYHHEPMTWTTRLVTSPSKPLKFKMTDRPE